MWPIKKVVDTKDKDIPKDDALVKEVMDRFELSESFDRDNRVEALDDLMMLAGFNHWPAHIVKKRDEESRPHMTINKLPSFVDQVINNSRLNKMSIKVRPNGGGATQEMADTMAGLIKNIEEVSNAASAYQTGLEGAVNNGFGFFRIITQYCEDVPWDQEILFRRIKDSLSVRFDPYCVESDGSDANWAIVEEMISRAEYKVRYPGKDAPSEFPAGDSGYSWSGKDDIRVAEYWTKIPDSKEIYLLSDGRTVDGADWDSSVEELKAGEVMMHLEPNPEDPNAPPTPVEGPAPEGSGFPEQVMNPTPTIMKRRKVDTHKVVQYLVDGKKIIEGPTEWAGKYIPIIPVWGKELIISNKRFLRGLIRFAKDPQRMYNYFRTAATETTALAPKAPYIGTDEQFEGHEAEWDDVGTKNQSRLTYKHQEGVAAPARQVVTQTAIGEITESNISNDEMKSTTSLYDASLGMEGNEISGRAIHARQYKGDVANYVFHDNLVGAIRFAGRILVDLIPKIYDTERQVTIISPTEDEQFVTVNQVVGDTIINNLSLGNYKVTISVGPSFSTQRMEASQSMMDFIRVAPEAASMVIDLIAENQDWPGAAKIAKRFKKMLPAGIDDDAPMPPAQPSIDDIIKELKSQGITLGNEKKKLDIVSQRRDLTGHDKDTAEAGAEGAMRQLGLFGQGDES